jgi:hypothetical protein
VIIVHEDGTETIFRAGESFVIPKGAPVSWKQTESLRKFYVVVIDEEEIEADDVPETLPAVRRIDPTMDVPDSRGVYAYPRTVHCWNQRWETCFFVVVAAPDERATAHPRG